MSLLYAPSAGRRAAEDPQHSVSIFTASSRSRIEKAAECFRRANAGVATVLGDDGNSAAWRLLAATHVTADEAAKASQALVNGLDYPRAMACLGSAAPVNIAALKAQTEALPQTPRQHPRAAPAVFDGVGVVRRRSDDEARYAIVEGRYYAEPVQVSAVIASLQGRFPGVHFVAVRHDGFYFAAVTGFVDATGQAAARHAMRQRGALELTALATFKPLKTELHTPASTDLVSLQGTLLPKPSPLTSTAEAVATEILEYEDLFEALQPRVLRCSSLKDFATGEGLAQCAGVLLDETTLTRCLLDSNCPGPRVLPGFKYTARNLVQHCLGIERLPLPRDIACASTRLDPVFRAMVQRSGIASCYGTPASSSPACKQFLDLMTTLCKAPEPRLQDAPHRFNEEVERLNKARALPEVNLLKFDPSAPLKVQVKDLGAFGGSSTAFVDKFRTCNAQRGKNDAEALACFQNLALKPKEQDALKCMAKAGSDLAERARCFTQAGNDEAQVLDRAQCASQAGRDPAKLVGCAGGDAAALARATQDYECVAGSASPLEAARKCVKGLPPEATQALNCAAAPGVDRDGYLRCLGSADKNVAAAQCLWEAESDQARLACVSDKLVLANLSPAAQQAIGCAVAGGDMAAIGSCVVAANLPPEIGRGVQCAGSSTGAVDFALCAVDVGLNPELRIAGECASSTGGEPVSFTSCAGGRLTLRELQKCLSGEVGTEGGCFGPNNTLIKALNDMGRDLREGLGATNDLVVAVREIEKGVNKLGEEVSKGLQHIGDEAKRGDIGKAVSRVFGW